MSSRTLVVFIGAIVVAVFMVMMIKNRNHPPEVKAPTGPQVLVATMHISAGTFLHSDKQLAWAPWPAETIAPNFIMSDQHKIEEFSGAVARRSLIAGEPITTDTVVRNSEGGFMSAVLTPGMRAVSIAVNPTSGNAGFIFPGDRVDLILTHKIPMAYEKQKDVMASETFIENVRVLAIDQMLDNPDNKAVMAKTITLEVTPKQVEMINVAVNLGTISASLRSLNMTPKVDVTKLDPAAQPITPLVVPQPQPLPPTNMPTEGENYTTGNEVSKLMGDKVVSPTSRVTVYHGSTNEKIDFHQEE